MLNRGMAPPTAGPTAHYRSFEKRASGDSPPRPSAYPRTVPPPARPRATTCVCQPAQFWRQYSPAGRYAVKATCGLRSAFIPPAATQGIRKRLRRMIYIASPREHNRSAGPQVRRLGSQE